MDRDDATIGTGTLTVNAKHIALEGTLTQQGFASTTLNSAGDVTMISPSAICRIISRCFSCGLTHA